MYNLIDCLIFFLKDQRVRFTQLNGIASEMYFALFMKLDLPVLVEL